MDNTNNNPNTNPDQAAEPQSDPAMQTPADAPQQTAEVPGGPIPVNASQGAPIEPQPQPNIPGGDIVTPQPEMMHQPVQQVPSTQEGVSAETVAQETPNK